MLNFFTANWFWILFLGGMLFMHVGHRGHGGSSGHGGCGGGHASQHDQAQHDQGQHDSAAGSRAAPTISLSKARDASAPQPATPPFARHTPERHPAR